MTSCGSGESSTYSSQLSVIINQLVNMVQSLWMNLQLMDGKQIATSFDNLLLLDEQSILLNFHLNKNKLLNYPAIISLIQKNVWQGTCFQYDQNDMSKLHPPIQLNSIVLKVYRLEYHAFESMERQLLYAKHTSHAYNIKT